MMACEWTVRLTHFFMILFVPVSPQSYHMFGHWSGDSPDRSGSDLLPAGQNVPYGYTEASGSQQQVGYFTMDVPKGSLKPGAPFGSKHCGNAEIISVISWGLYEDTMR